MSTNTKKNYRGKTINSNNNEAKRAFKVTLDM